MKVSWTYKIIQMAVIWTLIMNIEVKRIRVKIAKKKKWGVIVTLESQQHATVFKPNNPEDTALKARAVLVI